MAATGSGSGGAAGRAPAADQVRNVVLVGHSGTGKSSLVEALLAATGTIQRPGTIQEGTTVSDFDEVEVRQQRSVNLTLAPIAHNGIKVNLLDTPGYADFTGDLRAGLRAADSALFAVSATDGIDGVTRMLWEECAAVGMPRAVVITKIDHQRAEFQAILDACREAFGDAVAPLYLPVGEPVTGLIGLLSQKLFSYSGGQRTEGAPAAEDEERMAELRGELIEGIITESEDETLMDRYLSGEDIDPKVLIEDLEKAVARGSFYPVLVTSAPSKIGMLELLEVMTEAFPSPAEHPIPAVTTPDGKPVTGLSSDPKGPLLAEVVKTTTDSYVGRISLVRVFSGTLRPDASVHVSGHGRAASGHQDHDDDERIGARTSPLGQQQRPVTSRAAGAVAAGGDRGQVQGRRGQTLPGPEPADRRGPDAAPGEQRRDQAAGAVVHGRGARRRAARPARQPVRGGGGDDRPAGAAAGDDRGQGPGPRPQRQAVRRSRRVRHLPHRGGAAGGLGRLRVRRQDRRRGGAQAVHPVGGEGRPLADGAGRHGRLPDGWHPGHPVRRQGALGGLLRHGLPEGRAGGAAGRGGQGAADAARAGRRGEHPGARRLRGRGDVGPVRTPRPGARLRAGRRGPDPGQGGDRKS